MKSCHSILPPSVVTTLRIQNKYKACCDFTHRSGVLQVTPLWNQSVSSTELVGINSVFKMLFTLRTSFLYIHYSPIPHPVMLSREGAIPLEVRCRCIRRYDINTSASVFSRSHPPTARCCMFISNLFYWLPGQPWWKRWPSRKKLSRRQPRGKSSDVVLGRNSTPATWPWSRNWMPRWGLCWVFRLHVMASESRVLNTVEYQPFHWKQAVLSLCCPPVSHRIRVTSTWEIFEGKREPPQSLAFHFHRFF